MTQTTVKTAIAGVLCVGSMCGLVAVRAPALDTPAAPPSPTYTLTIEAPAPTPAAVPELTAAPTPAPTAEPEPALIAMAVLEDPDAPKAPISDEVPLDYETQQLLLDAAAEYELSVPLVLAVVETESQFDPAADNGICVGLMQVHKGNRRWCANGTGKADLDLYDTADNLRAGCWILATGLELYREIPAALYWYNTGAEGSRSNYTDVVTERAVAWSRRLEAADAT